MRRVFVYGTLKRGYGNYQRLLTRSRFVATGITIGRFDMLNSGFPVLRPSPTGYPVSGEVFEVDDATVASLDHLEGEGRMYHRRRTVIRTGAGLMTCEAYIGAAYWNDRPPETRWLADGVYTWGRG
jgi:gamma-glutamylcyclotransferase (GGCT)/AIG2-like uncharacterized protein YtfP